MKIERGSACVWFLCIPYDHIIDLLWPLIFTLLSAHGDFVGGGGVKYTCTFLECFTWQKKLFSHVM